MHRVSLLAAVVGLVTAFAQPASAAPDPNVSVQRIWCIVGRHSVSAEMHFLMTPSPNWGFTWTKVIYRTSPKFKANRVQFSYGKDVKLVVGGSRKSRHDVPRQFTIRPKNVNSALPAHLTMLVATDQGPCKATFI